MRATKETIYAYIYAHPRGTLKKELIRSLRRKHAYRRERDGRLTWKERGLDKANIDTRPKHIEHRKIPGHWEGDLMLGTRMKYAVLGGGVEQASRSAAPALKITRECLSFSFSAGGKKNQIYVIGSHQCDDQPKSSRGLCASDA